MMCLDIELRISEALKDPHPSQVVADEINKIKQNKTQLCSSVANSSDRTEQNYELGRVISGLLLFLSQKDLILSLISFGLNLQEYLFFEFNFSLVI